MPTPPLSRIRCALVWLLVSAIAGGGCPMLARAGTTAVRSAAADGRFDTALVGLCALVLAGCGGWGWLVTSSVVADLMRRGMPDATGIRVPLGRQGVVRRLVLAACGAALTGGLAAPAMATPGPLPVDHGHDPLATALVGLPLPDRAEDQPAASASASAVPSVVPPAPPSAAAPARPPRDRPASTAEVVVAPGDSLWRIASEQLRARHQPLDDAMVTHAWHALYALNRDRVGADPDLIVPATRLRMPDQLTVRSSGLSPDQLEDTP